ncbi:dTMP kinase [Rhodoblastus sp.]|uniref:dTMP kinase n=1 Tax=Rhodoblastus sp. TaxID=1962975 RepID=UPI003F97D3D0
MRNGRFITFEGGEGAGKSTQIRRLAAALRAAHAREVVTTREPGGTPLAERLRAIILAGKARDLGDFGEALLFSAARIDHIDRIIRPALARGAYVLCDRFADSTRAYQGARGGAGENMLTTLERVTLDGVRPDLTFILDLPPEVGLARAEKRRGQGGIDRFEGEAVAFHAVLREKFLEIARAEPERCRVIDAVKPEEDVAEAIFSACREKWPHTSTEEKKWA